MQKWVEAGNLTPREAEILDWYLLEKKNKRVSPTRRWKLCNHLLLIRRDLMTKPYHECSTEDIERTFAAIKTARRNPRKQEQKLIAAGILDPETLPRLKINSVSDKQRILRTFCLWMCKKNVNPYLDAETIKEDMLPERTNKVTVNPNDLLTDQELERFFSQCRDIREKCMFSLIVEGGLRCADIGNLRWMDIVINSDVCRIKCDSKTGITRTIPIRESRQYLCQYIDSHPFRDSHKEEDLFFLNKWNKPISQASLSQLMKRTAIRAGIDKPVHLHLLRHTRVTQLINHGIKETHLKMMVWGNIKTAMLETYVHLQTEDLEDELARIGGYKGVKPVNKVKWERKPTVCPNCNEINPSGVKYCLKCSHPLTKTAEDEFNSAINILLQKLQQNPNALSAWMMQQQK